MHSQNWLQFGLLQDGGFDVVWLAQETAILIRQVGNKSRSGNGESHGAKVAIILLFLGEYVANARWWIER